MNMDAFMTAFSWVAGVGAGIVVFLFLLIALARFIRWSNGA